MTTLRRSASDRSARYLVALAFFTAFYYVVARLGLTYALVQKNASPVWPPTGVALGVMLLYGRRFWPGVLVGALLVNYGTGVPLHGAVGMAIGNTLEALVGVTLLQHLDFRTSMARLRDVLAYIVASVACSTVSATLGATSLALAGEISRARFVTVWSIWCVGDLLGAILVGPFILAWKHGVPGHFRERRAALAEAVAIALLLVAVTHVIFASRMPVAFGVFPLVLWAAFRFGLPGATTTTLIVATLAVLSSAHGAGPFSRDSTSSSAVSLR